MTRRRHDEFAQPPTGRPGVREPTDRAHDVESLLERELGGRWQTCLSGATRRSLVMWLQTDDVDGRTTITGMLVLGDPLSASDLRKLPLGALETAMNAQRDAQTGPAVSAQGPLAEGDDPELLPPLVREPGMRPEDWSKLVAAHYRAWARRGANPGAEMARRWGVNRQTVAAWIREARLRGLLPPARRSKGGGA